MELEKAQVAGICWVCKKLWPCSDHPPRPHCQICGITLNGQEISEEIFGALQAMMDKAEKDASQFSQDIVEDVGFQSIQ